ncbi:hypothetical protein HYPSUDRAFT_151072, partial [Hypholoma sublateritium FD-334 SS-4]
LCAPLIVAMVNPGGFIGLRKEFLDSQQAAYDAAMQENDVADVVANIQRRYFKRFPVTLLHTQEPSPEHLAAVDDDAPDPELIPPPQDDENPEAYARARRVYEFQIEELKMRKAQIKRRLQYVHNKSKNSKTSCDLTSVNDPMTVLTSKITGMPLQRPRLRTAYNLWGPHHRAFIDPIFQERVKEGKVPASRQAALRSAIYKELFEKLPKEERDEWANRAEDEHREAMAKVEKALKSEPSSDPTDRQRIINSIPGFVVPILDLIADHTGWKVSLFLGGPEPADGGRLNMVGLHSGVTSGSIKMNYGRSERTFIKDHLYGNFGKFLGKCYLATPSNISDSSAPSLAPAGPATQPVGLETSDITGAAASTPPLAPASHAASVANCPSAAAPTHMPSSDYEQGTSSSAVRSTPESAVAPSPNAADDSSSTTACRSMATATPPAVADATVNDSIGAANSSIPAKDSSNASIPAANSSTTHKGGQKRKSKGDDSSSAKKRKTGGDSQSASTSNTGSSSTSNGVAGAPAWVSKALALFRSTSLGPEWDELVASWLRFEQTTEYKGVSKLGNQNRPAAVGDWIQRASLQPAWRLDGATDLLRRGEGDWTHLQCSGVNGLLSIVAGLFFWGCEVQLITATSKSKSLKSAKSSKALKSAKSEWMQSLEDVSYVFTQL